MTSPAEYGVSVVICTYNGSNRIAQVLDAIAVQEIARPVEVVLVDNNSNDGVGDVARRHWDGLPAPNPPLRVIVEREQGLAAARSAGIAAARYEYILFCDDDNLLHPGYLQEGARLMDDPRIAVVGGGGVPIFEEPPPPFVYSRIGYWACGDRSRGEEEVGARHIILSEGRPMNIFGAGMFARRDNLVALARVEGFPVLMGRQGAALTGGDDCEICFMLMLAGGLLVYSDDLRFDHLMPAGRMTADYFHRLREDGAAGREYWRRLAECHMARRDGWRNLRPGRLFSALLGLAGRRDRGDLHIVASTLGITMLSNETERAAMRMARRARALKLAGPRRPRPVELEVAGGNRSAALHDRGERC